MTVLISVSAQSDATVSKAGLHIPIRMSSFVFQFRSKFCHQYLDFLRLPVVYSIQQSEAHTLEALDMRKHLIPADLLQLFVFRPGVRRRFEKKLLHVHKPSLFKPGEVLMVIWNRSIVPCRCFTYQLREISQIAAVFQGSIV